MPTVAVIGASTDRSKFGNKAVRAYVRQGWTIYPVHPTAAEIEGVPAFVSLRDVPGPVQRIAIYLPPEVGIEVLPDIAAVEHEEFFVNPGAESEAFIARAKELGLDPMETCAIIEVGESPSTL
jgi:predicted CoA-binding protein